MANQAANVWLTYPEAVTRLAEEWHKGTPTQAIADILAEEFHTEINKNQVIGKSHRLGLPLRASPIRNPHNKGHTGTTPRARDRMAQKKRAAARDKILGTKPKSERRADDQRPLPEGCENPRHSECQFILNDGKPWRFCCRPVRKAGGPYCETHWLETHMRVR